MARPNELDAVIESLVEDWQDILDDYIELEMWCAEPYWSMEWAMLKTVNPLYIQTGTPRDEMFPYLPSGIDV